MEIVEDRHGNGSTLITSQLPRDKWHDVIGEPTFADAILDRIVHNAYRLELDGPSMRKLQANARAEPEPQPAPRTKRPEAELHTSPNQQKENRNDRRAQLTARPGGSTGTSRARRRVSREGTPRRARVPPIDYRDGLSPCLTNSQETDITTVIQRRRQHPRRTAGRDRSEQVVAIRRNGWSRSSVCPPLTQ